MLPRTLDHRTRCFAELGHRLAVSPAASRSRAASCSGCNLPNFSQILARAKCMRVVQEECETDAKCFKGFSLKIDYSRPGGALKEFFSWFPDGIPKLQTEIETFCES